VPAPLFRQPVAWRALDLAIGCTMWLLAGNLLWPLLAAAN
jgi:L-lysine exporter family protein LysE/ArgO